MALEQGMDGDESPWFFDSLLSVSQPMQPELPSAQTSAILIPPKIGTYHPSGAFWASLILVQKVLYLFLTMKNQEDPSM